MSVSDIDKRYYQRFARDHQVAQGVANREGDKFWDLADYLYKGGLDSNHGPDIKTMDEVNAIKSLAPSCRNRGWRAVDTAANILYSARWNGLDTDGDPEDADYQASLQNFYSGQLFLNELKETTGEQGKMDLLVSKAESSGLMGEPTAEEIQFRNWLSRKLQSDSNVKEILEIFGNFYSHANELKRASYDRSSNVEDIVPGNHIPDILPSEYLMTGIEELEVLFDYQFVTKSLMQYDRRKKSSGKKGPIVLGLDTSGSMYKVLGKYSKMNVAIGFTMAIIKALDDDDRRCQVFTFDTSSRDLVSGTEPLTQRFETLLNLVPAGGTELQQAILHGFKKADRDDDVMIVTDGIDTMVSKEAVDSHKGQRRLSTLLVGEYEASTTAMSQVSDSFIVANDTGGFDKLLKEAIQ